MKDNPETDKQQSISITLDLLQCRNNRPQSEHSANRAYDPNYERKVTSSKLYEYSFHSPPAPGCSCQAIVIDITPDYDKDDELE